MLGRQRADHWWPGNGGWATKGDRNSLYLDRGGNTYGLSKPIYGAVRMNAFYYREIIPKN